MSGGIRTSVKGYLLAQRLTLALDPLLENENINNNVTAPLDPPPRPVEDNQETTMDSTTYGLGICDGNIPCFPMLNSAKGMASYRTRTRAERPPPQGVNLNSNIPSVSVPLSPQTEGERLQSFNLKSFHYNELRRATGNFRPDRILGEGGYHSVFKGWIDEQSFTAANKPGTGMAVAIKRLNREDTLQSYEKLMEVMQAGQLSHPNLVKLIGYCLEDDNQLLVYEFVPNGSLDDHIFSRNPSCLLSWNLRMKIALGAAKALAFLHNDEAKCIYVDFETSKILLDSNYNVKIYGYGLTQRGPEGYRTRSFPLFGLEDDNVCLDRWFLPGPFRAPECVSYAGNLTPRSDVYSFGVVLLEILSGRRAIERWRPVAEQDFVKFFISLFTTDPRKGVRHIIDPRMGDQYSISSAFKALKLARQCLSVDSKLRPDMYQVIEILEKLQSSGDREASGTAQTESGQNLHGNSCNDPNYHRSRINRRPKATAASPPKESVS